MARVASYAGTRSFYGASRGRFTSWIPILLLLLVHEKLKAHREAKRIPPDKARLRINSPRFRLAGNLDGIDVWMPWERMGPGSCGLKGLRGGEGVVSS